jgi:hypothetical protein
LAAIWLVLDLSRRLRLPHNIWVHPRFSHRVHLARPSAVACMEDSAGRQQQYRLESHFDFTSYYTLWASGRTPQIVIVRYKTSSSVSDKSETNLDSRAQPVSVISGGKVSELACDDQFRFPDFIWPESCNTLRQSPDNHFKQLLCLVEAIGESCRPIAPSSFEAAQLSG